MASILDILGNALKKRVAEVKAQAQAQKLIGPVKPISTGVPAFMNSPMYIGEKPKSKFAPGFVPNTSLISATPDQEASNKQSYNNYLTKPSSGSIGDIGRAAREDIYNREQDNSNSIEKRLASAGSDAEKKAIVIGNVGIGSLFKRAAPVEHIVSAVTDFTEPLGNAVERVAKLARERDSSTNTPFARAAAAAKATYEGAKVYGAVASGVNPLLKAVSRAKLFNSATKLLPEDTRQYVQPAMELYSMLTSPDKITTGLSIAAGRATAPASDYINEPGRFSDATKDALNLILNIGEDAAAIAVGKKVGKYGSDSVKIIKSLAPAVDMARKVYKETGDLGKALDIVDAEMMKAGRVPEDGNGKADVLGYRNVPVEIVNRKVPQTTTGIEPLENKPLPVKIADKLADIDRELGLATPESKDFGKAKGLFGNVLGAPAMLRKAATGSSLPLFQQLTGKGREEFAKVASNAMSQDNIIGKAARGTKALVGGLGKTEKSVDDLGKSKGLMADFNEKADFISKKVYDDLEAEAKQTKGPIGTDVSALLTPKSRVQSSLEKIHAIMDPELASPEYRGMTIEKLSPAELKSYSLLVKTSDVINDMSYQMGAISKTQWMSKQGGKYITRAYTPIDLPDGGIKGAISSAFGKKKGVPDLGAYKKRDDITAWKQENAIRDPVYLVNKRLVEAGKNMAVQRYFNQVANNPEFVSNTKRPGFVEIKGAELGLSGTPDQRLKNYVEKTYGLFGSQADDAVSQIKLNGNSDEILKTQDRMYAGVKGKFVRQDVLDDIQGFSFATDALQGIYDIAKRTTERPTRLLKIAKTALSMPTRLQNKVSNLWYAMMGGVNPVEMVAERAKIFGSTVKDKVVGGGDYKSNVMYRFLLKNGVLDSDFSKSDLQARAKNVAFNKKDNILKRGYKYAVDSYGSEDVKSKVAYASVLRRRGYSAQDILKQVRDNFQDYGRVGKVFDFASKMPIGGLPFSKWKSEGARLFKNSLVNRPLRAVTLMLGFQAMKAMMSEGAGESKEDRETRESRVGATTMPFSDLLRILPGYSDVIPEYGISTEVMIPDDVADFFNVPRKTAINIGRIWGQSLANEDPSSRSGVGRLIDSLSPVAIPKETSTKAAIDFFGSGLLLGPAIQTLADTNFIGGSIKDPEVSKWQPESFISPAEQWGNRGEYLLRQYTPPVVGDLLDMKRVVNGEQTYYGSKRTPEQQAMRALTGVKSEVIDSGRIQQMREYQAKDERASANARLNANIKKIIGNAASTKSIDMDKLKSSMVDYVSANSVVSEKEMAEALKMKKYVGANPEIVRKVVAKQKKNESTRNSLRLAMNEMVNVGIKNVGVRDEYNEKLIVMMKAFRATYDNESDYRKAGNAIILDMKNKWK